jgi:pectate lyase
MKKTILATLYLALATTLPAQSPVGYGGNATGGSGGTVVAVSSHAQLKAALKATGKSVIVITGDITFGEGAMISEIVKDKTLLGLKGVKLISTAQVKSGGILGLKAGSSNVVIRNLIFEGPGAYDVDGNDLLSNMGCLDLWVDHCEFYDGVDGNFDNTNSGDNITVSWCKFGYRLAPKAGGSGGSNDHRFTNLIGGSSDAAPADGHYSITFHACHWTDGCKERMPRARNAEIHILNCFYNTNTSSSTALGLEGGTNGLSCYVENTHFKRVATIYKSYGSGDKTLTFTGCLATNALPADIGVAPRPTYPYEALPASAVEAIVGGPNGAGATLDVTLNGDVSNPGLSLPEIASTTPPPTAYYDTSAGELHIQSALPVEATALYSLQGIRLEKITAPGLYLLRIQLTNGAAHTLKIHCKTP